MRRKDHNEYFNLDYRRLILNTTSLEVIIIYLKGISFVKVEWISKIR